MSKASRKQSFALSTFCEEHGIKVQQIAKDLGISKVWLRKKCRDGLEPEFEESIRQAILERCGKIEQSVRSAKFAG